MDFFMDFLMVLILRWQPTWDFEAEKLMVHQLILWVASEFVSGLGLMEKEMVVHQKVSWKNHRLHYSSHCEWASSLGDGAMPWDGSGSQHSLKLRSGRWGDLIVAHCFLRMLPIKKNKKRVQLQNLKIKLPYFPRRLGDFCQQKGGCQFNKGSFRANSNEI